MACSANPGIIYHKQVSRRFTITFSNVTPAIIGIYACQVANYNPNLFQTCRLEVKTGREEKSPDQTFKTLDIVLPVGLTVLVARMVVAVVFFLKHKGQFMASKEVCTRGVLSSLMQDQLITLKESPSTCRVAMLMTLT